MAGLTSEEEGFLCDYFGVALFDELITEILVDEGVDRDGAFSLWLSRLTFGGRGTTLSLFFYPCLPLLLFLAVVGNPVEQRT